MKLQKEPHIHIIDLYNEHYCYDVNTNAIFKVSDELAKYLQTILKSEKNSFDEISLSQELKRG